MLAEYDTAEDEVQRFFLPVGNPEPTSLLSLIEANQADIRAEVSNFRSYIAGGELHIILIQPEFYRYRVDGTSVLTYPSGYPSINLVDLKSNYRLTIVPSVITLPDYV